MSKAAMMMHRADLRVGCTHVRSYHSCMFMYVYLSVIYLSESHLIFTSTSLLSVIRLDFMYHPCVVRT